MPVIYNVAALYAHSELEMAALVTNTSPYGRQYMAAYFDYFPVSAPEEDQDDPNMLYYLRLYRRAKETTKTSIGKFPGGYEGWAKERGDEPLRRVMPPTTIDLELEERPIDNNTISISSASISELTTNEKMADNNYGLLPVRTSNLHPKKPDMLQPERGTHLNSHETVGIIEETYISGS
ncbi:hypothetical protein VE04_00632 [Pseudogymnoascus sp. 24MN13]|nr:hypothetical protein VE04_00632 [Pseudogymnoascus sp. 24MN13]